MSKFTQFTFSNGTKAMLSDIEVEDIRSNDYPDFCDAYISYCRVDGEDATDEQLEEINEDSDLVYESVLDWLY